MKQQQRRRYKRANARFPVWIKHTETGKILQGHTTNISQGGMYLLTAGDCDFPIGVEVCVEFGILHDEHGGYVRHRAAKGAEIVRLEKHGYGTGIAVNFAEAEVLRCEPTPAMA